MIRRHFGISVALAVFAAFAVAGAWGPAAGARAPLKAVIGAPTASPKKATAGKRFTVTFAVKRSDNGKALTKGKLTCDPSVAGVVISHNERFKNGKIRLSFVIPKDAAGKIVKVKVTIKVGKKATTRIANFRVAGPVVPLPGSFAKTAPANSATGQQTNVSISWTASSNATGYDYCVDATNNNACDGSWVTAGANTSASPSGLTLGATYYWEVRANNSAGSTDADSGSWWSFTTVQPPPAAGTWTASNGVTFTVNATQTVLDSFSASYAQAGCSVKVTTYSIPIANGQFSRTGSFYFNGTFDSPTTAHGTEGLNNLNTYGCGYWTLGPFSWTATWQHS
jgi:hypothetical protein